MRVVLFEPEIPPNTGNIARLCAGMETELHLIEPLGFRLEDRYLKRAGLDYWPKVSMRVWPDWQTYMDQAGLGIRHVMTSARGGMPLHRFPFLRNDALVFGPETRGLPSLLLTSSPHRVRIPITDNIRSLNLSTAAGIVLFQAMASSGLLDEGRFA
ncbi:MAG: tRNA (cytidine(34)-2'-O)-methyltransferase [Desulfovibrionaceae bacterium]|nr:tRNA (cytidine(34)-2'-O)-methyltransferase [Desulfovibrionaceae bacterium]